MRKAFSAVLALGLAVFLSGCVGQSEEEICKNYFKAYGDHLVTVMNGETGAFGYATALTDLAEGASGELKEALLSDAALAPDGFASAGYCKKYLGD
jgi:hypothetical protein